MSNMSLITAIPKCPWTVLVQEDSEKTVTKAAMVIWEISLSA